MKIKLSNRELWLLAAAGAIFILYFFYLLLFTPLLKEVDTSRQQLASINQDLKTANAKANMLKSLEAGLLDKPHLKKTREGQMVDALQHISAIITSLNLDLLSIKPHKEEIIVGSAKAILFDVDIIGTYGNVFRFMQALEKLPILILIDSANLKHADKGLVEVSAVLSIYY